MLLRLQRKAEVSGVDRSKGLVGYCICSLLVVRGLTRHQWWVLRSSVSEGGGNEEDEEKEEEEGRAWTSTS